MRVQNRNVYLATSGGCQRENTAARVSLSLVMPHDANCHLVCQASSSADSCQERSHRTAFCQEKHLNACSNTCRRPIGIPDFMQHFWWCFDRLKEYAHLHPGMPAYFRFMTVLGEDTLLECCQRSYSTCSVIRLCDGHVVIWCFLLPCFSVETPDDCTTGRTVMQHTSHSPCHGLSCYMMLCATSCKKYCWIYSMPFPLHNVLRNSVQQVLSDLWHCILILFQVSFKRALLISKGMHSIMQPCWQQLEGGSAVPYSNHLLQR